MKATHPIRSGGLAAALLLAGLASAEPLDLDDATPRWIEVSFENSPADRPAQRATTWSAPMPAWLRPAQREGWLVVAIPPDVVEGELLAQQDPVPGSFGPFVWLFDARSGHVVSAELEGVVRRRLHLGFLRPQVPAQIFVQMGTERAAGFHRPRSVLGQWVHEYCDAPDDGACNLVTPAPFDRATGYVNAVGLVEAHALGFATRSFSSLGEARFSERTPRELLAASSASSRP